MLDAAAFVYNTAHTHTYRVQANEQQLQDTNAQQSLFAKYGCTILKLPANELRTLKPVGEDVGYLNPARSHSVHAVLSFRERE